MRVLGWIVVRAVTFFLLAALVVAVLTMCSI